MEPASAQKNMKGVRRGRVQSLDRAMAILRAFQPGAPVLGVSEIARLTGLTLSTAHRLLAEMEEQGLIRRAANPKKYTLGTEIIRLAAVAQQTFQIHELAAPFMITLRDVADETVALHITGHDLKRLVLFQVQSSQPLRRIYTEIGTPIPLHQGAPGKALLANLSEAEQEQALRGALEAATPRTIVDPPALRKELEMIRKRGYAVSLGERVQGISSLAAVVFDHTGRVAAAISVSGPSIRMTPTRIKIIAPQLLEATAEITARLNGRSSARASYPSSVGVVPGTHPRDQGARERTV